MFLFVISGLALIDWALHKAVDLSSFQAYVPPAEDDSIEEQVFLDSEDYRKESGKQKLFSKSYTANFEEYLTTENPAPASAK